MMQLFRLPRHVVCVSALPLQPAHIQTHHTHQTAGPLLCDCSQADGGSGSGSRRLLSSGVSVLLFVSSVEAAWQAQQRVLRPLPIAAQRAAAPLQLGLRVARVAVWSAALVLAAAQTRAACHAAGDSICAAAEAAAGATQVQRALSWVRWLPTWVQQRCLPLAGFTLGGGGKDAAAAGDCEDGCSGDGSAEGCASVGS